MSMKREEIDSDETESDWFGYACNSGEIMFYYNIKSGEHRWPTNSPNSENTILRVQTSNVPPKTKKMFSVATQTEDYACVNHCTSVYVYNEKQMENTAIEIIDIEDDASDGDTIDANKHKTFNSTDVDENLNEVSEDYEMDESLSTIISEMKSKKELVQNLQTQLESNPKTHDCCYCSRTFKWKSSLERHLRTHTDKKPYDCSYCDKAFPTKTKLNIHLRTHTGEKPYECSYCDKSFSTTMILVEHIRTHTGEKPYKCLHCDKAFAQKGVLSRHVRTHTGEKPFKCWYCSKTFTRKTHLDAHFRRHTGDKPYKCSYCNKAFAQKCVLDRHIKTHTDEGIRPRANVELSMHRT